MSDQLWSWILSAIGVLGFILAGRRVWWAWYINIANQALWIVYASITAQWGFYAAALVYIFVFGNNAYRWTKERYSPPKPSVPQVIGHIDSMELTEAGLFVKGTFKDESQS